MHAMILRGPDRALEPAEVATPDERSGGVVIDIEACGICRTDLHLLDGELPDIPYPVIPGHQIVGRIVATDAPTLTAGDRVGVPWLGFTCGRCDYCVAGNENLCDAAGFTGYTRPGGFAQRIVADPRYCFPLDPAPPAAELAPLLCAGLIGYRALRKCGDAEHIGIYGFGAAAHLLAQVLSYQRRPFYAFTRRGDAAAQSAARELGAAWVGPSDVDSPRPLDAAIIFAAAGELVPRALAAVRKGGTVVCGGIHMSPIPSFPYALLWGERRLVSVANLTRVDGEEFLGLASRIPIRTHVETFRLDDANHAIERLRNGDVAGSAVLEIQ
jgi:propanol-preferring alcohol dehydrogenase